MKKSVAFLTLFAVLMVSGFVWAEEPASAVKLLQPFVEKHELAGAVALVADKEKVLYVDTVGYADVAAKKAMKPDALFWIASQSKPMTAVAVMMLVDEGKISLDDPVQKYLPEFLGQMVMVEKDDEHLLLRKPSHPITIREALSHTTGLPFRSAMEGTILDSLPLEKAVLSYAITPLQTEPGTQYAYSNAGINTAARVLEVVSGMAYEDFMQQRLFTPLGMKDTTFWPTPKQVKRIAKSYDPDETKKNLKEIPIHQLTYPLTDKNHRFPMPAGGIFSTAQDTAKFCQMLLNGGELNGKRYLSKEAFKELTSRQTPESVKASYGFGLVINSDGFGHGGAYATDMEINTTKGVITVWMVQHDGFPGEGEKAEYVFKQWAFERFGK